MRVKNEDLLDVSGSLDLENAHNLSAIWLGHIAHYSIQIVFAGTPDGVIKLQASNDVGSINSAAAANQTPIVNWTDLGVSTTVSQAGSIILNQSNVGYNWVRAVWTPGSGNTTPAVAASYNDQVAGMTTNVELEANEAGVIGNSIVLTFDGVIDIAAAIVAWNAANPENEVSLVAGDDTQVPNSGEEIVLAGGVDALYSYITSARAYVKGV